MSLYGLARSGDVQELRDLLRSDTDAIRQRAAELLGDLADEDDQATIDALVGVALEDGVPRVREAAIDALESIGQRAVEQLLAALTGGDDANPDRVTARKFARALESDRPEVRMAAANALSRLGDRAAVPALAASLDDEDPRVRRRVCQACESVADPRLTQKLVDRLADVPRVRRAAANALGAIGTDRSLASLVDLLDDSEESIRRIAAESLGKAENARPVEPLARALTDESELVRTAGVYSVIELLSNVPTERSHDVRDRIVTVLRAAEDASVVDPLIDILIDGSENRQRRNAAWILGRVGDSESVAVVEALADALDDDDEMTAQFAATSLVALGGSNAESVLLDRLEEGIDDDTRARIVFVLGQVGGRRSLDRLESIEDDESQIVRERIFTAVSKLRVIVGKAERGDPGSNGRSGSSGRDGL